MTKGNWVRLIVIFVVGIVVFLVSPPDSPRFSYAIAMVGVLLSLICFISLGGYGYQRRLPAYYWPVSQEELETPASVGDDVDLGSRLENDRVAQNRDILLLGILGLLLILIGLFTA